jgi:UDP-N-acetylmuramyl pentapeptide phosphotransferase/UDP-N-acetylglucosamine-1-phosphate transferase
MAFVAALVVAAALTPAVTAVLRRRSVLDHPNLRSSHAVPTPRGGGIAVVVAIAAGLATSSPAGSPLTAIFVILAILSLIGVLEDLFGIPALLRLGLQTAAAAACLPWLLDSAGEHGLWRVVFGAAVLFWLVGYTNVFNFMDGINGISGAQAALTGSAFAVVGAIEDVPTIEVGGLAIAGAGLGFLPFNFPRAQVFLGDVGSYALGGGIAAIIVLGLRARLPVEAMLAPTVIYLTDTGSTLLRRLRRGETWWHAHREHTYQQLVDLGWSHSRTTIFAALCTAACSLFGLASLGSVTTRLAADVATALVAVSYLSCPKHVASSGLGLR